MKKYIKATIDHSEDSRYQQLYADVVDVIMDHISGNGMIQAQEMKSRVSGYDPDWCAEEFVYDAHWKEVIKATRHLAELIADDYFKNYNEEVD